MTDQHQRTQWAVDLFHSFSGKWTPSGAAPVPTFGDEFAAVVRTIKAIAPKDDNDPIGYAVFQREIDSDWDVRQHPNGYVHTLTSAVFDKPAHAENAHQGASKRHPGDQYVICEIREVP